MKRVGFDTYKFPDSLMQKMLDVGTEWLCRASTTMARFNMSLFLPENESLLSLPNSDAGKSKKLAGISDRLKREREELEAERKAFEAEKKAFEDELATFGLTRKGKYDIKT